MESFAEMLQDCTVSPALPERLAAIRGALVGLTMKPRSVAAPYYSTDLGIRKFQDPEIFYKSHCEISGFCEDLNPIIEACVKAFPLESLGPLSIAYF